MRVLDLTDERSIYGAKLLAELGALTIRPEPANGDPLRRRLYPVDLDSVVAAADLLGLSSDDVRSRLPRLRSGPADG